MSLLHILGIQNTQNKIYNNVRRTYLDKGDFKEGESFCRKCKGVGEVYAAKPNEYIETCPQCIGRGIVDWVTQAVERLPILGLDSSSHSSLSSCSTTKKRGAHPPPPKPPKRRYVKGIFMNNRVTNYKRRKIV